MNKYIAGKRMTKEEMFYLRLVEGFNLPPIAASAVVNIGKEFLSNTVSGVRDGQIVYIAIAEEEGPGKSISESKHHEIILTLDSCNDMEVYQKYGLKAYRQQVMLRIVEEAREQNALLTIRDLVKLLKSSYSTIKRDIKELRRKGFHIPTRGFMRDIGPSSHKTKIVELYIKGYTPSEIQRSTYHSLKSIERYIKDFSRVAILTDRKTSIDDIRLIVGISERLIKEYHSLYNKYATSKDYKKRINELVSEVPDYTKPETFKKTKEVII